MTKTRKRPKTGDRGAYGQETLRAAIFRLDEWHLSSTYCQNIGAEVYRDPDGDLEFQVTGQGGAEYSARFKDLLAGPCSGYKGAALESRIKQVMHARLAEAEGPERRN